MSDWLGGAAVSPFPIATGTPLGGYADREGDATGTRDELEVGVLSLKSGSRELTIVTVDVIGVDAGFAGEVALATGLPESELLICASHTHSGPLGVVNRLHPAGSACGQPDLRDRMVKTMARTIGAARSHLEPVRIVLADATVEHAWSNRNDPDAATDTRIRSLQVRRIDGSLLCLMMLIPCHPTVLGAWNTEVSADLHGGVRRAVRTRLSGHDQASTLLTITGAAGDISTRFARRESSLSEVNRLGDVIAEQVVASLKDSAPVSAGIQSAKVSVKLPMRAHDIEGAQKELVAARRVQELAQKEQSTSHANLRRAHTRVQGAEILLAMIELQPVEIDLRAWRFGEDFGLISVPGELFSSLGRRIEAHSLLASTWIVGYANGYAGYFPDQAAYDNRTYEALASPYDPTIGELVLEQAVRVLGMVAGGD